MQVLYKKEKVISLARSLGLDTVRFSERMERTGTERRTIHGRRIAIVYCTRLIYTMFLLYTKPISTLLGDTHTLLLRSSSTPNTDDQPLALSASKTSESTSAAVDHSLWACLARPRASEALAVEYP